MRRQQLLRPHLCRGQVCWQWISPIQIFVSHRSAQSRSSGKPECAGEVTAAAVGSSGCGDCDNAEDSGNGGEDDCDPVGDPEFGCGVAIHVVVGLVGDVDGWWGEGGGSIWSADGSAFEVFL